MLPRFISQEQARHTYDVELRRESSRERSFGDVRLESEDEWNALLSRAAVKNTHADASPPTSALEGKDLVVFYTGLYRALTFPRRIDEPSARGAETRVHWSPYSKGGSVHDGTLVTDNGFWDTFRAAWKSSTRLQYERNSNGYDRTPRSCVANSPRAIGSSKNEPNRLRCDRAREF